MLTLPQPPKRRRVGLTPMIDVVFLLLVFFMLAARFGVTEAVPLRAAMGGGTSYDGPPRLVSIQADGLRVNGQPTTDPVAALRPLMRAPDDIVVIMPVRGVTVSDLTRVIVTLLDGGIERLSIVEARQ